MKFQNFFLDPDWTEDYRNELKGYYDSIWNELEYVKYGLSINKGDVVVDCGANIGIFSNFAANKDAARIIAFEAEKNVFDYLKKNTLDAAITAIHGTVDFIDKEITDVGISREIYDLNRIFSEFQLNHIDFLKIDIEASEFGFLLTAADDLLRQVKQIAMELHFCSRNPDALFIEYECGFKIIEKLSLNGFVVNCEKIHKETCCYNLYAKRI